MQQTHRVRKQSIYFKYFKIENHTVAIARACVYMRLKIIWFSGSYCNTIAKFSNHGRMVLTSSHSSATICSY